MKQIGDKLSLILRSDFSSLGESLQEEVYQELYRLVYGIAFYMLKDHMAAEDVVQDVFIKISYNAPVVENEHQLRAWIKVVTKNHTINILKKNKKIRNQDDLESVFIDENITHKTVEKEVEAKMLKEHIEACLTQINPDYRMIIELKWKKGKSHKEIAEQLGVNENAIKQKLYRARESLRTRLREKWGFDDE